MSRPGQARLIPPSFESLDKLPPTLTVPHAGRLLGLGRDSAYRAAAAGELPTIKFGRRLFVPTARLLRLLGLSGEDEA
jgi:excisionase family DNA binding protein